MEDQAIIALFWKRQEEAIAQLDKKYGQLLRHVVLGIVHDRQDMEELISDSYMKIWDSVPPAYPRQLAAYSLRIARNTALSLLRYRQRDKRDSRHDILLSELEDCLPASYGPEQALEEAETLGIINSWLETLRRKDRIIFVRRYFAMDSMEGIAADLGMSANAVAIRLHRARTGLKQELEKEGFVL